MSKILRRFDPLGFISKDQERAKSHEVDVMAI